MNITEQLIQLSNVRLNIAAGGSKTGKPILLLHGYPDAWFGWEKVMEALIKQGFRVIAPDQRGYNLSDKPNGIKPYYTNNLAKDALELMTHFGYEKFTLAGHDYGAYVAWFIGLQHNERVEKLIIISGVHPTVLENIRELGWQQWLKSWYLLFFHIPYFPEWLMQYKQFKYLFHNHSKDLTNIERQRYIKAWSQSNSVKSMINWYRVPRKKISNPYLKMPVLILLGENDLYLTKDTAIASLQYCPKGQLQIIPKASHWLMLENTKIVVHKIRLFLK